MEHNWARIRWMQHILEENVLLLWDPEQKGSCLFYGSVGLVEGEGERVRSRKELSQSGENMLVKAPGNEVL